MHYTGKVFIDRNYAGRIMGLAPEADRKHDLEFVCRIGPGDHGDVPANAERMAACWNACQGIPTEFLTSGRMQQLFWLAGYASNLLGDIEETDIPAQIIARMPGGEAEWKQLYEAVAEQAK